jgi:hypothetical protein
MELVKDLQAAQLIEHFSDMKVTIASTRKAWALFDSVYKGGMSKQEYLKMQAEEALAHFARCGCTDVSLGGEMQGTLVSQVGKCDCHGTSIIVCLGEEVEASTDEDCQRLAMQVMFYHYDTQMDGVHTCWVEKPSQRTLH